MTGAAGSQRARLEAALASVGSVGSHDPNAQPHACSVLVVEADADMRAYVGRSVAATMRQQPCRVVEASTAEAALGLAREYGVALIVADADAPGGHGAGLAEAVAADPDLRRTPVVLLSSDARLASASARPLCAVVPKPFTRRGFASALDAMQLGL